MLPGMGEDVREQLITFIGGGLVIGGTASRLPENYYEGVSEVFGRAEDEDWQVWWESTGLPPLELWCWIGGGIQGAKVRRRRGPRSGCRRSGRPRPDSSPGETFLAVGAAGSARPVGVELRLST